MNNIVSRCENQDIYCGNIIESRHISIAAATAAAAAHYILKNIRNLCFPKLSKRHSEGNSKTAVFVKHEPNRLHWEISQPYWCP